jgi:hypothetical protein
MAKLALSFLFLLTCAATTCPQGMRPNYVYLHEALVYPGSGAGGSVVFSENIYGSTDCNGACPPGVVHIPYIQLFVGNTNGECGSDICSGQPVPPGTTINYTTHVTVGTPFTGKNSELNGWVYCSYRNGTISSDPNWVSGYLSSVTTFMQASPNSSLLTKTCTVSGDTTPAWLGIATNPYGTQGGSPQPLYFEEMSVVISPAAPPTTGFTPWPVGTGAPYGYNYLNWTHGGMRTGLAAPMPQVCTQLGTGLIQYNPGTINTPN